MIVAKIGGSIAHRCPALFDALAHRPDVALVHGFGPQTDQACHEAGIQPRTIRSPEGITSRFTDEAVLDAMQTAARRVQRDLAAQLDARGATPERLGLDIPLFWAKAKPALRHEREDGRVLLVRGNRSGRVDAVQPHPVQAALDQGHVPVVTPLALDEAGLVSVDADRAAAALAGALDADALVLFTDVPGLLTDPEDPSTRVDQLPAEAIDQHLGGTATDGMARKLVAAREATHAGVPRALVADGRAPDPLESALAGDATEVTA